MTTMTAPPPRNAPNRPNCSGPAPDGFGTATAAARISVSPDTQPALFWTARRPQRRVAAAGGRGRRAQNAARRPQQLAATAASCGILTFYVAWRFGLIRRISALAGPCCRALQALSTRTARVLRIKALLPPQAAATAAVATGGGSARPSACEGPLLAASTPPGGMDSSQSLGLHSVRLVALPPRRAVATAASSLAAATVPGGGSGAMAATTAAKHSYLAAVPDANSEAAAHGDQQPTAGAVVAVAASCAAGARASGPAMGPVAQAVTAVAVGCRGVDGSVVAADTGEAAEQQPLPDAPLEVHLLDLRHVPPLPSPPPRASTVAGAAAVVGDVLSTLEADLGAEEVIGLDAEWEPELRPGLRHRISVIQLASANRCWVLQPGGGGWDSRAGAGPQPPTAAEGAMQLAAAVAAAAATEDSAVTAAALPGEVVRLLTNPWIIKAGIGIQEDVRRLERDFGVRVRGAVDVRLVAQAVAPHSLAAGGSLQALAGCLLGRQLDKSAQRSHWGAAGRLEEAQIAYAAHDAWLSRELLCELHRRHRHRSFSKPDRQQQMPPLPQQQQEHQQPLQHHKHQLLGKDGDSLIHFAAPFQDIFNGLKTKRVNKALGPSAAAAAARGAAAPRPSGAAATAGGDGGSGGAGSRPSGRCKEQKLPTRKSVLYENCRLLAPDGAVLCTCGAKKVCWYLQRGLARVVAEDPTTIQLNFEPRGRGHADDEYYLSDKENRCCVCGAGGEYLRHSVVPHCYRQHFPASMKSHLSHDIVLMCPSCHGVCSVADQRRMEALGREFAAPLGSATAAKFRHDSNLGAVRSAGRALANTKVVIPLGRRRELEDLLRRHFGLQGAEGAGEEGPLDAALVQRAANVDPRTEDENWRSHAELVVRSLGGRARLETFVRGWRQHFLDTMAPRFMPRHWRVDARAANSSVSDEEDEKEEEEEEEEEREEEDEV